MSEQNDVAKCVERSGDKVTITFRWDSSKQQMAALTIHGPEEIGKDLPTILSMIEGFSTQTIPIEL